MLQVPSENALIRKLKKLLWDLEALLSLINFIFIQFFNLNKTVAKESLFQALKAQKLATRMLQILIAEI